MKTLALLALLGSLASAAEVCPPGGAVERGARAGALDWTSTRGAAKEKICLANELHNVSGQPLQIAWKEAGIEAATLAGRIAVSVCCLDGAEKAQGTLRYGAKSKTAALTQWVAAEEGAEGHEEGFPDLLEEDARVRTVGIRGDLRAGTEAVHIDLVLKVSASKFAKQFAYQYSITDRSTTAIELDWDLLREWRAHAVPSVQPIPGGKTYLFLSDAAPRESEAVLVVKTKSGAVAGRFRFDAFTAVAAK